MKALALLLPMWPILAPAYFIVLTAGLFLGLRQQQETREARRKPHTSGT